MKVPVGENATVDASSYFTDADGDGLAFTVATSNAEVAGASVSNGSVTVTATAKGLATITVTARDPHGEAAQQRFQVTVPNRGPETAGDIPVQTLFTGQTATVDASAYFRDPDGDALTYNAASSSTGVATVAVSAAEIAIRAVAPGVATITVDASDADGASARRAFPVTVPNRAPEAGAAIPPLTLSVGETATVDAFSHFTDADGDSLVFTAATSNAGVAGAAVLNGSVTVTAVAKGLVTITVTARDPHGEAVQQRFRVTVPNRPPEPAGTIPARELAVGEMAIVDASSYFADPDGDSLSFTATSSNAGVATVRVSGSSITVEGLAPGGATITVTADDGEDMGSSVFDANVSGSRFRIDLVFATPLTEAREAAFRAAAGRWMAVLAPTELPDVRPNGTLSCGDDPKFRRNVEIIDDVMIVVAVDEIDGRGGTLGKAGICRVRTGSLLPFYGRVQLDEADVRLREQAGRLEDLILHEIGHVLGIGTLWTAFGLVHDLASETARPDTYFSGRRAREAFEEAGGANYSGAKVPVENAGGPGTRNAHWREVVLASELMTGYQGDGSNPLSAITAQSLADLGYTVDPAAADPYGLPDAEADEAGIARSIEEGTMIPYGDDIWRGPIIIADPEGRIVGELTRRTGTPHR